MQAISNEHNAKRPGLFVIGGGLVTSALSLFLVYLLGDNFNIMGYYLYYIIPIGAIGVGLVAGSGYGVVSLLRDIKISKALLWSVVGLQLGVYFAANYIEYYNYAPYYDDGTPVSFFQYFDFMARSFAWTQKDGSAGNPLGIWGYAFRALEATGFALGGLIVPFIFFKKPYCKKCQIYMKTRDLCLIPAGPPPKKIKKKAKEAQAAYEAEINQGLTEGQDAILKIQACAEKGQFDEFKKIITGFVEKKKTTTKLTSRIALKLVSCRRCYGGYFSPTILTGQGEKTTMTPLDKIDIDASFVRQITR